MAKPFEAPGPVTESNSEQLEEFAPGTIPGARINSVDPPSAEHAPFHQTEQPDYPICGTGNEGGRGEDAGAPAAKGPSVPKQPSSGGIRGKRDGK